MEERNLLLENQNIQLQTRIAQLENEYREFKQQTLKDIVELKQLVQRLTEAKEDAALQ